MKNVNILTIDEIENELNILEHAEHLQKREQVRFNELNNELVRRYPHQTAKEKEWAMYAVFPDKKPYFEFLVDYVTEAQAKEYAKAHGIKNYELRKF
jgi:hypothetical protein